MDMIPAGQYTQQFNQSACFYQEFGSNRCKLSGKECVRWNRGEACSQYTRFAIALDKLPEKLRPYVEEAITDHKMVFVEPDELSDQDLLTIGEFVMIKHPFLERYITVNEENDGNAAITIYEGVQKVIAQK